ncbi:MAG: glycosyltransferase family 2 protein [Terrimicrobiaceae bacterium]
MSETGVAISVVIPTKGRAEAIGDALRSVGSQTVKVREVVVVDGSAQRSDVGLLEKAFEGCPNKPHLIYRHAPEDRGLTAARNRSVRISSGELIQFLDDDAVLAPDYFEHLLPVFHSPDVGGASGLVIEPTRRVSALKRVFFRFFYLGPFRQIREEAFLRPGVGLRRTNTLPGVSAYRREVFGSFHFDENLTGPCVGEDVDFSYRLGKRWQMVIEPSAKVFHYPSPAERQSVRRNFAGKVAFYNYHYRKNIARTALSRAAYVWLNFGFVLHSLTSRSGGAFLGVCDGMRDVLQRRPARRDVPGL